MGRIYASPTDPPHSRFWCRGRIYAYMDAPQNASGFFGGVRRKAVRLSRTFGLSIAAFHLPRARMEMRGSGPNRPGELGGSSHIPGCPDPVSTTVCPYPSSGLPTFLPARFTRPPLRRGAPVPCRLACSASAPRRCARFVGQRHRDEHPRLARKHPGQPRSGGRAAPDGPANHRHRARNQQPPHVALPHLRYPAQPGLAARGVLPGDEPEPGGEVTTPPEAFHRRREGLDRRRRNRPDPRDAHQASRLLVRAGARAEPSVQLQGLPL